MSSPAKEIEKPSSSVNAVNSRKAENGGDATLASNENARPPAKRQLSASVIEISDTESDDSDICAVSTYQASADEVKRIRRDYSSTSSSSSYSSDSESGCEDDSRVLPDEEGFGLRGQGALLLRAGRMDDPVLNPNYKSEEVTDKLATHWKEFKEYTTKDITLTTDPFRLCVLHNFLENSEFINNIVDDMNTLDWSRKKMDLYEFHQTADLANLTWQRSIRGIYQLLKTDVMSWVSRVLGLELTEVSASCSLYGPGDHLLPHDDLLGDRRVAFILYLAPWTPPRHAHHGVRDSPHHNEQDGDVVWCEGGGGGDGGGGGGWRRDMGGSLQLLSRDTEGRLDRVRRALLPANNMMALFKVDVDSYHQVDEVMSLELPRLSINGWFHGPAPAGPEPPAPESFPPPEYTRSHTETVVMSQWVQPAYMSPRARLQVCSQMERASEVSLHAFLPRARHAELLAALSGPGADWERCGPADLRRCRRLRDDADNPAPAVLRQLCSVLGSAAWLRVLAECTGLVPVTVSACEVLRWRPGDYWLLPPRTHYGAPRLDLLLHLAVPRRTLSGGHATYVAPGETDAAPLVSVPPHDNALSLVYCDAGAARFIKYLSRITMRPDEEFYLVTCSYRE